MRLPRFAELTFARACAAVDAIAHPPDEDQNGWDFMVEFAQRSHSGPADMQPPAPRAFVQVKSKTGGGPKCKIKLSNALKAAQSREPWFIVLFVKNAKSHEPTVYAVHVWQEMISTSLRAIREAENEGGKLNQKYLTVSFSDADCLPALGLVQWMEECLSSIHPDYSQRKRSIYESVGFEAGFGTGTFSLSDDREVIFDNLLGLGEGLAFSQFSLTRSRFGIPDREPTLRVASGIMKITPSLAGACDLRFRGEGSATSVSIPASVYSLGFPMLPADKGRLRFAARGIEFVWSPDGYSRFQFTSALQEVGSLAELENVATLLSWFQRGSVDLQVWTEKGRALWGSVDVAGDVITKNDWSRVAELIRSLRRLSGGSLDSTPVATIADIFRGGNRLYFLHQVVFAPSLMVECVPVGGLPDDLRSGLYYCMADFADWSVMAIVERPLRSIEVTKDGQMQLTFDASSVRESWILKAPVDGLELVQSDYARILKGLQESGNDPIEFRDIEQVYLQGKADRQEAAARKGS